MFLAGTRFDDYSSAYDEPNADGDDPYDRIIVDGTKVSLTTLLVNMPHLNSCPIKSAFCVNSHRGMVSFGTVVVRFPTKYIYQVYIYIYIPGM